MTMVQVLYHLLIQFHSFIIEVNDTGISFSCGARDIHYKNGTISGNDLFIRDIRNFTVQEEAVDSLEKYITVTLENNSTIKISCLG